MAPFWNLACLAPLEKAHRLAGNGGVQKEKNREAYLLSGFYKPVNVLRSE